MQWSSKYCIGVERIDLQHKGLFTAVNRVMSIIADKEAKRTQWACKEAITYLKSYTLRHFEDEEAYQLEIGYEGYEEHKALHDAFVARVLEMEKELVKSDYSRESVRQLVDMVTDWLLDHVMNADQKIVKK